MISGIRIKDLLVPALADTQAALDWGARLTIEHRKLLLAAYKGLELAALNARSLQDRIDFATTAQLWREAAEAEPVPYPDSDFAVRNGAQGEPATTAIEQEVEVHETAAATSSSREDAP